MLSNPIYYGHFRHNGELHEGKHEPIISKKLYDEVQAVLLERFCWSKRLQPVKPKPYLGLLRCAECGGAITAEVQKGHTHYRCTKKGRLNQNCKQPYIREGGFGYADFRSP